MAAEPATPEGDEEPEEVVQLSIDGDGDLSLTIGGSKPDEATLSFGGGEIQVRKGQFKPGQRVAIMLVGPVVEAAIRHKRDPKTGQLTNVKRKHTMQPDQVRRVSVEQAEGPSLVK